MTTTQPHLTLAYAKRTPTARRQIAFALVAILAAIGLCGAIIPPAMNIRQRIHELSTNPNIGPVNWLEILASPTRMRVAWIASRFDFAQCGFVYSNRSAELPILGSGASNIDLQLQLPLQTIDGKLSCSLCFTNRGPASIVIPPLHLLRGFGHTGNGVDSGLNEFFVDASPVLGRGNEVLAPGESIFRVCQLNAGSYPARTSVTIIAAGHGIARFRIGPCESNLPAELPYDRWEDVPESELSVTGW